MEQQALQTLCEMVVDRGYLIKYKASHDNLVTDEKDEITFCLKAHRSDHSDMILGFILEEDKLTIQGIKDRIAIMNREAATTSIIIYRTSVTSSAKKSMETLEYGFELFSLDELQLNITRHRLVPHHRPVTPEEKAELDHRYKGKLPQILNSDAVCRYYAFKKGDYTRITRKDGSVLYRVVK